jgi:excisionase family DNA binding protein
MQDRRALPQTQERRALGSLLDYDAAASYLCTTPRHVRELWAKRQLTAIKVGRCVRFAEVDLDAFISRNRVGAVR